MGIVHIVMFEFKPEVGPDTVKDVGCTFPLLPMFSIPQLTRILIGMRPHARSKRPMSTPPNKSTLHQILHGRPGHEHRKPSGKSPILPPEITKPSSKSIPYAHVSIQNGISHIFVVEFENQADRDHYVKEDQAHLRFVQSVGPLVIRAQVLDFVPGVLS